MSSVLPIHNSELKIHHKLWQSWGDFKPVVEVVGYIPTFWFWGLEGENITNVKLVRYEDNVTVNVTSDLMLTGLEYIEAENTQTGELANIVRYASWRKLTSFASQLQGLHYLIIDTNKSRRFWSDMFTWCGNIQNNIKLTWWNTEPLHFSNGTYLDFSNGFSFRTYIKGSGIGKPAYKYINTVTQRNGVDIPQKRISVKEYTFGVTGMEYFFDAIRLIPVVDCVQIEYNNNTYLPKIVELGDVEWNNRGDYAESKFTFQIGEVAVNVGSSQLSNVCNILANISPELCLPVGITVRSVIEYGSVEYVNRLYVDANGDIQDLQFGEYVLVSNHISGVDELLLMQLDEVANDYLIRIQGDGKNVYVENEGEFYMEETSTYEDRSVITSSIQNMDGTMTIQAIIPDGSIGEVKGKRVSDTEWTYISEGSFNDFEVGITFDLGDFQQFRIETYSARCGFINYSNLISLIGVGTDIVGSTEVGAGSDSGLIG